MLEIVMFMVNFVIDIVMLVECLMDIYKMCCILVCFDFGGGGVNVVCVVYCLGGDCVVIYFVGGLVVE